MDLDAYGATWNDVFRLELHEYHCGAVGMSGRECGNGATRNIGSVPLCHVHFDAALSAIHLDAESRHRLQKLQFEQTKADSELRQLRYEVARYERNKTKLRAELDQLRKLVNERRPIAKRLRQQIAERDGSRCAYCNRSGDSKDPDGKSWHIDHDIPVCRGGLNEESNLVLACAACNLAKRDRTGDEFRALLATPTTTDKDNNT
jgi:5-methylcytosine-specific restriction endonuclease McrA